MAVDDRAAGPPEAVPDEQVVHRGGILAAGTLGPLPSGAQDVHHRLRIEGERVVRVEHEHGVVRIGQGRVRAGDDARTANAPERVRRRAGLRMAERVALGGADLRRKVSTALRTVDRTAAAERREERCVQRHAVRHLQPGLVAHRRDRAEGRGQPRLKLGRGHRLTAHRPNLVEAVRPLAGCAGQRLQAGRELEDGRQSFSHIGRRGRAAHSSRSRLMTWTSMCSPRPKWAWRRVPSWLNPAFSYERRARSLPA